MPTTKPRINLTVEPEVYEIYKQLSELQGRSMASIITELVTETLPHMRTMLSIMQVAKELPATTIQRISQEFDLAEKQALEMMGQVGTSLDQCNDALKAARSNPPYTNRGVTTEISANPNTSTGTRGKGSLT